MVSRVEFGRERRLRWNKMSMNSTVHTVLDWLELQWHALCLAKRWIENKVINGRQWYILQWSMYIDLWVRTMACTSLAVSPSFVASSPDKTGSWANNPWTSPLWNDIRINYLNFGMWLWAIIYIKHWRICWLSEASIATHTSHLFLQLGSSSSSSSRRCFCSLVKNPFQSSKGHLLQQR